MVELLVAFGVGLSMLIIAGIMFLIYDAKAQ